MSEAPFFSAAERSALDRVTVPAMRAGAAASALSAALAASGGIRAPRRAVRGIWRRPGRIVAGTTALLLVSAAAAAATGLLERLPIAIPGITHLAAKPEVRKLKHVAHFAKPRVVAPKPIAVAAEQAETVVQQPMPVPTMLTPMTLTWRERRAARIAAGLPVRPMAAERRKPIERLPSLPPDVRATVVARYLANHPRIAAHLEQWGIDPTTADGQRRLAQIERRRSLRAWQAQRDGVVGPFR